MIPNQVSDMYAKEHGSTPVLVLEARALRIIPPVNREAHPNRVYTVEVRCPYCNKVHTHGWRAPGGELLPQRLAHCTKGRELYPNYTHHEYRIDAAHLEAAAQ